MQKTLDSLTKKSSKIRGEILEEMTKLERTIDIYLVSYFTSDQVKQDELMQLVFATNRITLDSKRQILEQLLLKHNPDFLSANKMFKGDLLKLIEHRNILAHHQLNTSIEAIEKQDDEISYLKYKNKIEKITYTNKEIFTLKLKITKSTMRMLMLLGIKTLG